MRDIKFRGRKRNGEWIYGDLQRQQDAIVETMSYCIFPVKAYDSYDNYVVDGDTVGQFTGLLDKNGKEIYEGDILKVNSCIFGFVEWHEDGYFFINDSVVGIKNEGNRYTPLGEMIGFFNNKGIDFSVIGNIHDNPELIK